MGRPGLYDPSDVTPGSWAACRPFHLHKGGVAVHFADQVQFGRGAAPRSAIFTTGTTIFRVCIRCPTNRTSAQLQSLNLKDAIPLNGFILPCPLHSVRPAQLLTPTEADCEEFLDANAYIT